MAARAMALASVADNEAIVLAELMRAARANAPCPTNEELARAIGAARPASASWIVGKLERRGLIEVYRWQTARIVTIVATGHSTRMIGDAREHVSRGRGGQSAFVPLRDGPAEPPLPDVVPLPRVTCFNCGATSLTPCAHLRRAGWAE